MFKITEIDKDFQKLIDKQKQDLNNKFIKSFKEQESVLKVFVESINHCDCNNFNDDKTIWNAAGYINLISLDLKHFARDLAFADDEWGKRIYARMISMLIYESINDLLDLLGKDFRIIIKKLSKEDELMIELNSLSKTLNNYKSLYINRLKEIRNIATAHRDNNLLEQYKIITSISWTEFIEIGSLYDNILNDLGRFMQKTINLSVIESKK